MASTPALVPYLTLQPPTRLFPLDFFTELHHLQSLIPHPVIAQFMFTCANSPEANILGEMLCSLEDCMLGDLRLVCMWIVLRDDRFRKNFNGD